MSKPRLSFCLPPSPRSALAVSSRWRASMAAFPQTRAEITRVSTMQMPRITPATSSISKTLMYFSSHFATYAPANAPNDPPNATSGNRRFPASLL